MSYVLENERSPRSLYNFCKENNVPEKDFYAHFGSVDGLKAAMWNSFYDNAQKLLEKNAHYSSFTNKDKPLSFYFSFFELLALNRSYVFLALQEDSRPIKTWNSSGASSTGSGISRESLLKPETATKPLKLTSGTPHCFQKATSSNSCS